MARTNDAISGSQGRLRARPAAGRSVPGTGASPVARGDAGGFAAGGQRYSRQAASAGGILRRFPDPARPSEPAARPGRRDRVARLDVMSGDRKIGERHRRRSALNKLTSEDLKSEI